MANSLFSDRTPKEGIVMDQPNPHRPADRAIAAGPWYEALAEAINLLLDADGDVAGSPRDGGLLKSA